jgi:catechol 2,3-dioxygenase-like lactoylglutathione lyase family enzyme
MLQRADHIDLRVIDVEEAIAFFKRLGFVEVRRTEPPRLSAEIALPGPDFPDSNGNRWQLTD